MSNNKHFTFSERVKFEHMLNTNTHGGANKVAKILNKSRSCVYYELKNYTTVYKSKAEYFSKNNPEDYCEMLKRFPFVCNGCANTRCSHKSRIYSAYEANNKAYKNLHNPRKDNKRRKEVIKILNRSVCPLIKDGLSIHVAKNSVNNCDLSESTIRRYIELGLVNAKRIDLPRASRFRVKKEYKYKTPPLDINILNGRTYDDYVKYVESYPNSKVIQLDSVIGKSSDSKAVLTIFFKESKLQLGKLYNKKHNNVVEIMRKLYKLGLDNGLELFNVVLADNGTEFKKLHELEFDEDGKRICKVFFCDPYRSCQKAECEKNHVFFRRIWPKGRSLDPLSQEELDDIFSHINSYPRASLKDKSPYDLFTLEYSSIILTSLNILKIEVSNIMMKDYKNWDRHE